MLLFTTQPPATIMSLASMLLALAASFTTVTALAIRTNRYPGLLATADVKIMFPRQLLVKE